MTDHYEVLGLPTGEEGMLLTEEQIKEAFRAKAKLLHPDKRSKDEAAAAQTEFQILHDSYQVLMDSEKRRLFHAGMLEEPASAAIVPYHGGEGFQESCWTVLVTVFKIWYLDKKMMESNSRLHEITESNSRLHEITKQDMSDPKVFHPYFLFEVEKILRKNMNTWINRRHSEDTMELDMISQKNMNRTMELDMETTGMDKYDQASQAELDEMLMHGKAIMENFHVLYQASCTICAHIATYLSNQDFRPISKKIYTFLETTCIICVLIVITTLALSLLIII